MESFDYTSAVIDSYENKLKNIREEMEKLKEENEKLKEENKKLNDRNIFLKKKLVVEEDFYKIVEDTKTFWNDLIK